MLSENSQASVAAAQIIISGLIALVGGWTISLQVFVAIICLDYIAGTLRAAKRGRLNSTIGFNGMLKKTGYFVVFATFFQLGTWVGETNGQALLIRDMIVGIFIMNETVSIIENIQHLDDDTYLPHGVIELLEAIFAENLRSQLKDLPKSYDET